MKAIAILMSALILISTSPAYANRAPSSSSNSVIVVYQNLQYAMRRYHRAGPQAFINAFGLKLSREDQSFAIKQLKGLPPLPKISLNGNKIELLLDGSKLALEVLDEGRGAWKIGSSAFVYDDTKSLQQNFEYLVPNHTSILLPDLIPEAHAFATGLALMTFVGVFMAGLFLKKRKERKLQEEAAANAAAGVTGGVAPVASYVPPASGGAHGGASPVAPTPSPSPEAIAPSPTAQDPEKIAWCGVPLSSSSISANGLSNPVGTALSLKANYETHKDKDLGMLIVENMFSHYSALVNEGAKGTTASHNALKANAQVQAKYLIEKFEIGGTLKEDLEKLKPISDVKPDGGGDSDLEKLVKELGSRLKVEEADANHNWVKFTLGGESFHFNFKETQNKTRQLLKAEKNAGTAEDPKTSVLCQE